MNSTQSQVNSLLNSATTYHTPSRQTYCIRVTGWLDNAWTDWFDGLTLTYEEDETILCGRVADQSALHGILRKVHDLGLVLVEVKRIEDEDDGMMR